MAKVSTVFFLIPFANSSQRIHTNFSIICLHLYFFNLSPLSDEVKFLRRCFLSIVEGHLGNNPGKWKETKQSF